jgi:hypothetical protein
MLLSDVSVGVSQHASYIPDSRNGRLWNDRCWRILLQRSKVASVRIFGETLKREPVDDSDYLSRATEVAYEFCLGR